MKKFTLLLFIVISQLAMNQVKAQGMKLKITAGSKEFVTTLNDSDAAKEFTKMLPLSVVMTEHNGNEKYYNLPKSLSGKATNPGSVQAGDLMIWSSSTLVLFYAEARTSYNYIRLGKIDNPSGLQEAVGRANVKVSFEMVK